MNKKLLLSSAKTLSLLITMTGVLVLISITIGWNIFTMIFFWFFIVPSLSTRVPKWFDRTRSHLAESILGLVIFYALMILMIYSHYQGDFFIIMMISLVINVMVIYILEKPFQRAIKVSTKD